MAKDTAAIIKILKRLDLVIIFRSYPEPDMLTLGAPLSREVEEDLPKVREFWWELSLGPYRGMGADVVERCVKQFKQWRGIATRYEKRAANYRAMVVIAALIV